METVAVYWEAKIKTYGFNEIPGLSHIQLTIRHDQMSALGLAVYQLGDPENRMLFAAGHYTGTRSLGLCLVIRNPWEDRMRKGLQEVLGPEGHDAIRCVSPVGLFFFQGPHYGDRYGIADAAFRALSKRGLHILTVGCSASSIYLVLPEEIMGEARGALKETFALPVS